MKKLDWTQIKNDVNGNPRYVCHYTSLKLYDDETYEQVCKRMNKKGGRKYHTKGYGGGIVFQSYNLHDTECYILSD